MKKYHQLFLLIVSVLSISLFLIYRREYNRLHYVLEVFNFFGQPCNLTDLKDDALIQNDWGPQPIWQETDDGYVYSAFLIKATEVKAIALQNKAGKTPRTCYLWYEGNMTTVVGKFKSSRLSWNHTANTLVPYFYYCAFTNLETVPYAVSFSSKAKQEEDMPKTLLTNNFFNKLNDDVIACISPSFFDKNMFMEFISFHKMIGINTFLFYDRSIPYRLSKLLKALSHRLEINTTFLPWNYPKSDSSLTRMLVENDCLLRTYGHTKYVVTLELNEYIIPSETSSLIDTIKISENHFKLPLKSFCINSLTVNKPIALQNYEFINDISYNKVINIFKSASWNTNDDSSSSISERMSIHKYITCSDNYLTTVTDYSMNRFSTDFIRTTLVQLLLNGQI
ncbi:unnamed protein product [Phaedon cochleariae]|uniref:Glycosyltransferase family 92 protein n=1 Tax=Phaedon cochleariae TaxID=80249 RepID=A0A9N9X3N0_PHACE|nr:unnamed protein product [Phaedon cochleariae]